ncbi:hypothetical protein LINGRAHAP2_LOCUS20071 [Linum grandiflorum]
MDADKAPDPNVLNPGFYQNFWDVVDDDVFSASWLWLEEGEFPAEIPENNIVLLPKVDSPSRMTDLRSIS